MINSVVQDYLDSLAPVTAKKQITTLNYAADFLCAGCNVHTLDWPEVLSSDIEKLQRHWLTLNRASTVRTKVAVVRSLLQRFNVQGQLSEARLASYKKVKRMPSGGRERGGRMLTKEEVVAVWNSIDLDKPRGRLEAACFMVLITTGVRSGELLAARNEDLEGSMLTLRLTKSLKERSVLLTPPVEMLVQMHGKDHDPSCPYLLQSEGKQLTSNQLQYICVALARRADIQRFLPHDARRTVASTLLDEGVDIATVSKVMGHSSVVTTMLYDRRPEEKKNEAIEKMSSIMLGQEESEYVRQQKRIFDRNAGITRLETYRRRHASSEFRGRKAG